MTLHRSPLPNAPGFKRRLLVSHVRRADPGAGEDLHVCGMFVLTLSIGRVTGRLPKELADEVVESVLACFR